MSANKKILAIAAVAIAVILIGEVYLCTFNAGNTYSADSSLSPGKMSYSVHSGISNTYDVVMSDNGDFRTATEFYLYYDSGYGSKLNDVTQPIGAKKLDQEYYVSQLIHQLKNRGVEVTKLNASELGGRLAGDITAGNCVKGLIVLSGALPDTVYQGNSTDRIFQWIDAGGSLYWAGNLLGAYYSTQSGVSTVAGDYQNMFFGVSDCMTAEKDRAYDDITSNDYRYALSLMNNSVKYSLKQGMVSDSLSIGYQQDGYSSIVLAKHGSGMICVVGGDYSNDQRADLAQVIASHVCYKSTILAHASGTVTRGTVLDSRDIIVPAHYSSVYTYLGGYYLEYARCALFDGVNRI